MSDKPYLLFRLLGLSLFFAFFAALMVGCSTTPTDRAAGLEEARPTDRASALAYIKKAKAKAQAERVAALKKDLTPLEEQWGIKTLGLAPISAGYLLHFKYKVLDPAKATPILQRKYSPKPYLVAEKSGAKMDVPFYPKIGSLRSSVRTANQIRLGANYHVMFANPGKYIKSGDKVTVVIGDFKAEHIIVQ